MIYGYRRIRTRSTTPLHPKSTEKSSNDFIRHHSAGLNKLNGIWLLLFTLWLSAYIIYITHYMSVYSQKRYGVWLNRRNNGGASNINASVYHSSNNNLSLRIIL